MKKNYRENEEKKKKIIQRLFSFHRFGIKPGLERTISILYEIGNPQSKFPSIHVAGTNGKGSVCSIIASVLTEAGYKVGLYTSPHIIEFNERIRINGTEISNNDIIRLAEELLAFSDKIGATFFEITTAMAFQYFAENEIDIAIIETGMGGRFDSTNVLNPLLSVITSISKDHEEYLGNTIEEIACEKAGIIKPKIIVVISDSNKKILPIFKKKAHETGSEIIYINKRYKGIIKNYNTDFSMNVDIKSKEISYDNILTPLAGKHQLQNLMTAIAALEEIKPGFDFSTQHLKGGLKNIRRNTGMASRIELIRKEPPVVIDVAHNPAGIKELVKTIALCHGKNTKWNIIFGVMADKDIPTMLQSLKEICSNLILTKPEIERAATIDALEMIASELDFKKFNSFDLQNDVIDFVKNCKEPLLICGSFYLISDLLPHLTKN
jgi:dihydrofolate synthase / folylpolyglutamate synthase